MKLINEIAYEILEKHEKPMHYIDITDNILLIRQLKSQNPYKTVNAMLCKDNKFKRVSIGVYALANWNQYLVAEFAKDIAYEILNDSGKPMTRLDLGTAIQKNREFKSHSTTLVMSFLRTDKRFYYDDKNQTVGLRDWLNLIHKEL